MDSNIPDVIDYGGLEDFDPKSSKVIVEKVNDDGSPGERKILDADEADRVIATSKYKLRKIPINPARDLGTNVINLQKPANIDSTLDPLTAGFAQGVTAGFINPIFEAAVGDPAGRPKPAALVEYLKKQLAEGNITQDQFDAQIISYLDNSGTEDIVRKRLIEDPASKSSIKYGLGNLGGSAVLGAGLAAAGGAAGMTGPEAFAGINAAQSFASGYNSATGTPTEKLRDAVAEAGVATIVSGIPALTKTAKGNNLMRKFDDRFIGVPKGERRTILRESNERNPLGKSDLQMIHEKLDEVGGPRFWHGRTAFADEVIAPELSAARLRLERVTDYITDKAAQNGGFVDRGDIAGLLDDTAREMELNQTMLSGLTGDEAVTALRRMANKYRATMGLQPQITLQQVREDIAALDAFVFKTNLRTGTRAGTEAPDAARVAGRDILEDKFDEVARNVSDPMQVLYADERANFRAVKNINDLIRDAASKESDKGGGWSVVSRAWNKGLDRAAGMAGSLHRQVSRAIDRLQKPMSTPGGVGSYAFTAGSNRIHDLLLGILNSSPEDAARDHYVLYHTDSEYKKAIDDSMKESENE